MKQGKYKEYSLDSLIKKMEGIEMERDVIEILCKGIARAEFHKLTNPTEADKLLDMVYEQRIKQSLDVIEELSESPIEVQTGNALFFGMFIDSPLNCMFMSPEMLGKMCDTSLPEAERAVVDLLWREHIRYFVMPNFWIDSEKKYRVDFFVVSNKSLKKGKMKGVVIECDSYKWHGSPKAFARDIQRKRYIESLGWPIMTFSGSEIVKNPFKVGIEIKEYLERNLNPKSKK